MKRLVWWLAFLLVACQPPQHWHEIVNLPTPLPRGGTLIVGLDEDLAVFQPWNLQHRTAEVAATLTQSGLTRLDVRGQPQPELAESWQIDESGQVVTATLRADLRWSDGQSLTANDVVFTYRALADAQLESPLGRELSLIRAIETPATNIVVFTLVQPYSPLLTMWALPVLPRHILAEQDFVSVNLRTLTVGAGPFVLAQIAENGDWQLVANAHYHRGQPLFDAVTLRVNQTPESLAALSETDQPYVIDTQHNLVGNTLIRTEYPLNSVTAVAFNMRSDRVLQGLPLRHELIRLAEIDGAFGQSDARFMSVRQMVLPGNWLEVPELNTTDRALDEQLAQLGWQYDTASKRLLRNGEPLQLRMIVQSTHEQHQALARFLVGKWQSAGIEVSVELLDRQAYLARLTPPYEYDVAVVEWAHGRTSADYADTMLYDATAYWLFAGDEVNEGLPDTRGSLNIIGMDDDNYNMLYKSALATYDTVGRLNAERSASVRIHDVAPYYFVVRGQQTVIRSPRLAAIQELPSFATPWYLATVDTWYRLP